jgi:hypothetical protein
VGYQPPRAAGFSLLEVTHTCVALVAGQQESENMRSDVSTCRKEAENDEEGQYVDTDMTRHCCSKEESPTQGLDASRECVVY